ncbi:MAG: hypothetical protein C4289_14175, partial [Chloroflexota bacterium]
MAHANGSPDGQADRRRTDRGAVPWPWWERNGYRVVRAVVLLCIAGLASLAYFTSLGSGQTA